MHRQTIAQRIEQAGYTRGFDYLRIGLAFAVVLWHSVAASGDQAARAFALGPLGPFQAMILPMFFALSGFLVAGSLERSRTLEGFAALRVVRLIPALAVEVLLSALVLGPLLTSVPLASYFSDGEFARYFLNIIGWIHFELPGVFETNPFPRTVNISLWTVPYELECYLALIVLAAIGLTRRPRLFAAVVIALCVALPLAYLYRHGGIELGGKLPGRVLVLSFLAGVLIYLFRSRIPLSGGLAAGSFVLALVMLRFPATAAFCSLPAAYATVCIGLTHPPRIPVLMHGDYSYGVYLFAFPLQQTIASVPALREWWIIFLLTLPASLAYAAFSWHWVEAPVLSRKKLAVNAVEAGGRRIRSLIPRLATHPAPSSPTGGGAPLAARVVAPADQA